LAKLGERIGLRRSPTVMIIVLDRDFYLKAEFVPYSASVEVLEGI